MTTEEAIELLYDIQTDAVYNVLSDEKEALEMAINVLKQQPCEDAISRESVIEWLKDKDIIKTKNQEENARRELAELPSVTPKAKTGQWIHNKCNKCGASRPPLFDNFCPSCGARMEGE